MKMLIVALMLTLLVSPLYAADSIWQDISDFLAEAAPDEAGAATLLWPVNDAAFSGYGSWGPCEATIFGEKLDLYADFVWVNGRIGLGGSVENDAVIDALQLPRWFGMIPWHTLLDGTRTGACGWTEEDISFGVYMIKKLVEF